MKIELELYGPEELEAFAEFQMKLAAIGREAQKAASLTLGQFAKAPDLGHARPGEFIRRDNTQ